MTVERGRARARELDLPEPPLRVAVVGAGDASAEEERLAREVGERLAAGGAVVVTGGLGGVMAAAALGAWSAGGRTLAFLPGDEAGAANAWTELPVPTGLGEARNALVVKAGEAVVAVGGGWGTLSEIALARKSGRTVVLLGPGPLERPDLEEASSPEAAAERALAAARAFRGGVRI